MIEDEEWLSKYYYGNLEPYNGLILATIWIGNTSYRIDVCDGMNGIPYICISDCYNHEFDDFYAEHEYRINMDDGSNYQVEGENNTIDPYVLYIVRNFFLMRADPYLFYEPYMNDKSPDEVVSDFDFTKSIWYNSIVWLNISYGKTRNPNKPIVF